MFHHRWSGQPRENSARPNGSVLAPNPSQGSRGHDTPSTVKPSRSPAGTRSQCRTQTFQGPSPRAHRRNPGSGRHSDRAHWYPDAADERDHGTVGAVVLPRPTRPLPAVERTPLAARPARVRTVLQPAPRPSSPCPGRTAASRPGSDHRSRTDHELDHPPTRPARRNPPRVLTCRLNRTDGIFGRHRGGRGFPPPRSAEKRRSLTGSATSPRAISTVVTGSRFASRKSSGTCRTQISVTRPALTRRRRLTCTASSMRRSCVTSSSVPG